MTWIATLLAGGALLCAVHMLCAATAWARWLDHVTHGPSGIGAEGSTRKVARGAYVAVAMLGYGLLGYLGTESALRFLPTSLGRVVGGEWMPLREVLAAVVSVLVGVGVPLALTKLAGFNVAEARRAEAAERRWPADE